VLQDIPGARIDLRLAGELASEDPGRILLKMEVPPTFLGVEQAVGELGDTVPVFGGGAAALLYSELVRGASGTMPATAVSDFLVDVWRRFQSGDRDGARAAFQRIAGFLVTTSTPGTVPAFNREALVLRGVLRSSHGRTPGYQLTHADRGELRELLDDLSVLADGR
jgi:4-hydroxy-tetrahydrodipicolinate synthase